MTHLSDELSLLLFVVLNSAVFGSAWFFVSRKMSLSRSQALCDAALIGYAIQYITIGLAGVIHQLSIGWISTISMSLSTTLFLIARRPTARASDEASKKRRPLRYPEESGRPSNPALRGTSEPGVTRATNPKFDRRIFILCSIFLLTFIGIYARSLSFLPVVSNDALTYHFPAAVQWLQHRRIDLFQTWFFNPANTYSPLAGSMFIAWMIAPLGSDVLARFVEVPALVCVAIAVFQLCRQLGIRTSVAALVTTSAVLARPIFMPCMMGKDDLFVAFFFIASLVALSPRRSSEAYGPLRFGLALGLLLATKYTAMLTVPILLLAIDAPRWRARGWIIGLCIAAALAGPWYLRNWIITGNPLFPMFSLFTSARSDAFHSLFSGLSLIAGDGRRTYILPTALAGVLTIAWAASFCWAKSVFRNPLLRCCVLGIIPGLGLFFLTSPFPEVRFVLPCFLLLFAVAGAVIDRSLKGNRWAVAVAATVVLISVTTVFTFGAIQVAASFAAQATSIALIALAITCWAGSNRKRWALFSVSMICISGLYSFVYWKAYCTHYRESLFDADSGYRQEYAAEWPLWTKVDESVPADATVAYTNLYLIYPLQGPAFQRRLVFAPVRREVRSISDLGYLGDHLSGEKLVPAAARAAVAMPDRSAWLANLSRSGAYYLIIGKGGVIGVPPEAQFSREDPSRFKLIFEGEAGWIYRIAW